ncbi:DUF3893 domain-containing protein [Hymenobacter sp. BRD128]|uniref:RNaseH domain-containing protein n=1 Tax=Hymenobacter sp. BRD128 TaxID=2675878 RepID=UPI0015641058|nr:RNaseH domain-containing protein [Hymenobacter sp. BRD128]QKG56219.1 DUF3893 domain-containing protein [Hymenobacter sp. BRD128]
MPKNPPKPLTDVRLLRFTPDPDRFVGLEAYCLPFAREYEQAADAFIQAVAPNRRGLPIRQLNNLLLACLPTLAHGFEGRKYGRRLLVVGTPEVPPALPEPTLIHRLVRIRAKNWTRKYEEDRPAECEQFLAAVRQLKPAGWQRYKSDELVRDPGRASGLIYQALPALLATLLHGQTAPVGDDQRPVTWRRVQGGGGDRTEIYVVSQPFRARYQPEKSQYDEEMPAEKEGYFAYRLDFEVETQAGRFYEDSNRLRPWLFMRLSCQRYGHQALTRENFRRNVSVLTGLHTPRLADAPLGSGPATLVRLQLGKNYGQWEWQLQLPELLEDASARLLPAPELLIANPAAYGIEGPPHDPAGDEFYLIHAEGYGYDTARGRGHAIKSGFHLDERRAVLRQVLHLLGGRLRPDKPVPADTHPLPKGSKVPAAMRTSKFFNGKVKNEWRKAAQQGVGPLESASATADNFHHRWRQALRQAPAQLLLVYREESTLTLMKQQVQKALLLPPGQVPAWLSIIEVPITDPTLLAEYDKYDPDLHAGTKQQHYARQHNVKRQAWKIFLQAYVQESQPARFAFIEGLKKDCSEEVRHIKGAVRAACASLGVASQRLRRADFGKDGASFSFGAQSRGANAAFDLLVRQPGVLGGPPSALYKHAALPALLADNLDVIALYRREVQDPEVHYAVAVRLRATGEVDVLFPHEEVWQPYASAGPRLGQFLLKQRGVPAFQKDQPSPKLSPPELAQFAAHVVAVSHERPTLVLIEANGWRNAGKEGQHIWPQLKNEHLADQQDELNFRHVHGQGRAYMRTDPAVKNLLAVVRLRLNDETPQYLPEVIEGTSARDFKQLSAFVDRRSSGLLHFFSIGQQADIQKIETDKEAGQGLFKLEIRPGKDGAGAGVSFRHQQVVEFVPFFVHPDLQEEAKLLALCRILHYLRTSPAWDTANTLYPFPMHLAKALIDDYLCILD